MSSTFSMAEKILEEDIQRYEDLKKLMSHPTVLGQFTESRLTSWINEHLMNKIIEPMMVLGTGFILPDPNDSVSNTKPRRGQADIMIFQPVDGSVKFRQKDIFVITANAARALIEVKSTIRKYKPEDLEKAFEQTSYLKTISPDAGVFLVIRSFEVKTKTVTDIIEDWLASGPNKYLPDATWIMEGSEQKMFVPAGNTAKKTLSSLQSTSGVPTLSTVKSYASQSILESANEFLRLVWEAL